MFRAAIAFLVVALVAAVFGFGGIASTAAGFAKIVFFVALAMAAVGFVIGGFTGRGNPLAWIAVPLIAASTHYLT